MNKDVRNGSTLSMGSWLLVVCALIIVSYLGTLVYSNCTREETTAVTHSPEICDSPVFTNYAQPTATVQPQITQVYTQVDIPTRSEATARPEEDTAVVDSELVDDAEQPDNSENATFAYIHLTEDEIFELATLVALEAGIESYECQKAVASVVINRMTTGDMTLKEVIYAPGQFTPAGLIPTNAPTDSTLAAARDVVQNGPSIPEYVTYFRTKYFHNWAGMVDYRLIDRTYFSYSQAIKEAVENGVSSTAK